MKKDELIMVYNETDNNAYATTIMNGKGEMFPAMEDNIPREIPITYEDLRHINTNTNYFRDCILRIEPEKEEEIVEELRIKINNVNYITNEEIEDIILLPTTEKLNKLVLITSTLTMGKVKAKLTELMNNKEYFIAEEVRKIIDARYYEIYNNILDSALKDKIPELKLPTIKENKKEIKESKVKNTDEKKEDKKDKKETKTKK